MKRDTISDEVVIKDLIDLSFPLDKAVEYMETGYTYYLDSAQTQHVLCPLRVAVQNTSEGSNQDTVDFYFNIVTAINTALTLTHAVLLAVCYRYCLHFLTGIITTVVQIISNNRVDALNLGPEETTTPEENHFTTSVEHHITNYTIDTELILI